MTRTLGIALVGFVAVLIALAKIVRLCEDVEGLIEKQRYFNAHQ